MSRDGDLLDTVRGTTFVDDQVTAGQGYRYTVVALGADGVESPASTRNVTVPQPQVALDAPGGLVVSRVDGNVEVTWDAVGDASAYNLFRGTVRVYDGPDTSFVDANAPLGTNQFSVLAVAADGGLSERSHTVPITLSEGWGSLAPIVAAFPNLLPTNPAENGYEDSACGVGDGDLDGRAAGIAVCDYPSGIHLELRLYADQAALDAQVAQVATQTDPPTEWFYRNDDGTQTSGGMVYESPSTEDVASRFATFVREDRALFGLYVEWPGHSTSELFTEWWLPAPF